MLDCNKESLNLSRTQCGPFINLQICSLLWLKSEFKWDPVWVLLSIYKFAVCFDWKFCQFWSKVLIRFDRKFWSSLTESFHQFWLKVWSNFYQSRSSPTESFDQVWLKVFDQVWLEVLIKFDWKFSSILVESFDQAFINSGWKFWSSFYQFWSSPIESFDQVWMKVLINFGWKFWSSFYQPRSSPNESFDQVLIESSILIESFDRIRASPLYTWLVFIPLLESWFCWRYVSEVLPRALGLLVHDLLAWRLRGSLATTVVTKWQL